MRPLAVIVLWAEQCRGQVKTPCAGHKAKGQKHSTRGSRVIPQHSTNLAQTRSTSEIGRDRVLSGWYDRAMGRYCDGPYIYTILKDISRYCSVLSARCLAWSCRLPAAERSVASHGPQIYGYGVSTRHRCQDLHHMHAHPEYSEVRACLPVVHIHL